MLELKNLSKFYYNKGSINSGLSKVNLKFNMGEFVAITGESGSGKSTLLNVISGLDSYEEGELLINNEETSHYSEEDFENYRKKYVSNIYQSFNLINSYTVYQNIELVLLLNGYKKKNIKNKVIDLIKKVDLLKYKNTKVSKLSGGQKQRVAIARALAKETPIIIADEPTGNLDTKSAEMVIKLLSEIAKDKLVIVVTHNYEQVEKFATRKVMLYDGKIIEDRKIKEIKNSSEYKQTEFKKISFINKFRIGFRNTFNIFTKFILLFFVFLFMTVMIGSYYSNMVEQETIPSDMDYNPLLVDMSSNRIIIYKKNKNKINQDEYSHLEKMGNIENIIKNDFIEIDYINMITTNEMWIITKTNNLKDFNANIDIGRMPEKENEAILKISKMEAENFINKKVKLERPDIDIDINLDIVGIVYTEDSNVEVSFVFYSYDGEIYLNEAIISKLSSIYNNSSNDSKILFNNKYLTNEVRLYPNENVPSGCAYVNSDFNNLNNGNSVINKIINLEFSNMFYEKTADFKITKTYNKKNIKKLLDIENYEEVSNYIFINDKDFNNFYDCKDYQCSIYVNDITKIYETADELENLGYETIIVKDTINNTFSEIKLLFTKFVMFALLIGLFFISYFVIKIILKSRKAFFTIMRMLGAEKNIIKHILTIELFTIVNITFALYVTAIVLQIKGVIDISILATGAKYLDIIDFISIYVISSIISILLSAKYSKELFKKSSIKTFNEEV